MIAEVYDLAKAKLELNAVIKKINEDKDRQPLTDQTLNQSKLRYDIAVVKALTASWELDEFDLVLVMLEPREISYLVMIGAEARLPRGFAKVS